MRAGHRLGSLVLVGAALLVWPSCHRLARPHLGEDRELTAGIPVVLGSPRTPVALWEFGDGSHPEEAAEVRHAFDRPGRYLVRASIGGKEAARVLFTVVPRPVAQAIPLEATSAILIEPTRANLEAAVDFLERVVGAESAQQTLEGLPLAALATELRASDVSLVDEEEGLGLFTLGGFDGVVSTLGVTDGARSLRAAVRHLERQGGQLEPERDGSQRVHLPDGRELVLLVDRGYLYAVAAEPALEGGLLARPRMEDAESVAIRIRNAEGHGLAAGVLPELVRELPDAPVHLYMGPVAQEGGLGLRGLLVGFRMAANALLAEGVIRANHPLWALAQPVRSSLVSAPEGPILVVSANVPAQQFLDLLIGPRGSARRTDAVARFRQSMDLELLASALGGGWGLAYFDAAAFYWNLVQGSEKPEPRGLILGEAAVDRPEVLERALSEWLGTAGIPFQRSARGGEVRLLARPWGQPLEAVLGGGSARWSWGEDHTSRSEIPLLTRLHQRFDASAFGPGHFSAVLDLGQLRRDLEVPRVIEGVDPERMVALQAFTSTFLKRLTPIEHVFLDVFPDEAGGRIRGRLVLRAR